MIDQLNRDDIEKVCRSVQSFGFALLPGSIVPSVLRALQEEAGQCKSAALLAERSEELTYRANITSLGPQARDLLCSRQMTQLLSVIFGGSFVLTESRSCLTFYEEGDHLGPHLDKPAEECAVTIIVYVAATGPVLRSPQTGLELRIYGQEMTENCRARLTIPTHTGGIVVGHGSKFWHERPKLEKGEQVAALTGCYGYATYTDDITSSESTERANSIGSLVPAHTWTRIDGN
jgi:hypothetical protein